MTYSLIIDGEKVVQNYKKIEQLYAYAHTNYDKSYYVFTNINVVKKELMTSHSSTIAVSNDKKSDIVIQREF